MVVWVLRRIYCCILLNVIVTIGCVSNYKGSTVVIIYGCILLSVIVTNGCMSITKDLQFYYIECYCDEWLYEYYKRSTIVVY
jgi:hypothetical protein